MTRKTILAPHVQKESLRSPFLVAVVAHALLAVVCLITVNLFPQVEVITIGTGPGGGQGGDFVSVALADDPSGGEGMYKPALTPRPAAASPPPEKKSEVAPEPPSKEVFQEKSSRKKKEKKKTKPAQHADSRKNKEKSLSSSQVPRKPDPGSGGPGGASSGLGGGFGGGQGVRVGAGSGEGQVDSWYARQVEQRIGNNWLSTSLGQMARGVETVLSFEIRADGRIERVQLEKGSGISSVDLAAKRAIRASSPLPPLPSSFGGRRARFVTHFRYPPR